MESEIVKNTDLVKLFGKNILNEWIEYISDIITEEKPINIKFALMSEIYDMKNIIKTIDTLLEVDELEVDELENKLFRFACMITKFILKISLIMNKLEKFQSFRKTSEIYLKQYQDCFIKVYDILGDKKKSNTMIICEIVFHKLNMDSFLI